MKKILSDLFTGIDNQTYDLGRVMWAASLFSFLVMALGHVFWSHQLDYISCSAGITAINAGSAGSLAMKRKTEPQPQPRNDNANTNSSPQ